MAPRRRLSKNKDLPANLYTNKVNGVTYYKYRHPETGVHHGMGASKSEACAAARQLNGILLKDSDLVGQVMGTAEQNINHLIKRFKEEHLPTKKLAASTLQTTNYRLGRIGRDIGDRQIDQVDVQAIAEYLDDNFERDSYVKHRAMLIELFRFAMMKGLYPAEWGNPAETTYAKTDYGKDRRRMTLEQFRKIHAVAPAWLQIAMEIALITLQGRAEVISMKFDQYQDKTIRVVRQKTSKHEHSHLEIYCPELEDIIKRARKSGVASPYIVHRFPKRKKDAEGREHWTQLTPNHFTEQFRKYRDKSKAFDHLPREQRPTFHEIRALGSWLYKQAGYDNETYIQPLMAHADGKMTEHYQKGHQREWVRVEAGLEIKSII
ncbi:phage integrase Arm DNA-binding domain-containing protein [Marinobacter sp. M1N3S26]|uniref:phage integrase Arm DNA-binding domain-containing protein n=1 Tax=Marinobacter sp. M1N3S26 TaxID=3382299 RepID=UPI00387B5686